METCICIPKLQSVKLINNIGTGNIKKNSYLSILFWHLTGSLDKIPLLMLLLIIHNNHINNELYININNDYTTINTVC